MLIVSISSGRTTRLTSEALPEDGSENETKTAAASIHSTTTHLGFDPFGVCLFFCGPCSRDGI